MSTNLVDKESKEDIEKEEHREAQTAEKPTVASEDAGEKKTTRSKRKKKKKYRARKFPIWLRIIVVLILFGLSLIVGLMVGYGFLGDGNPVDALNKDTWQHIIDIVTKE